MKYETNKEFNALCFTSDQHTILYVSVKIQRFSLTSQILFDVDFTNTSLNCFKLENFDTLKYSKFKKGVQNLIGSWVQVGCFCFDLIFEITDSNSVALVNFESMHRSTTENFNLEKTPQVGYTSNLLKN